MREVPQKYQADLPEIKKNVRESYETFKPNYDRFNEFRKFIYESSLTPDELSLLQEQGRPQLEFPILPAYISRLLGEFSKQEPSIEVSTDDERLADPRTVKVVDQHLRHILFDASNHHAKYEAYKDLLSGGFSVFKVTTDYSNPMSFDQVIKFDRVFDPTLCGFDPMARYSHKGDGRYCFELFPKSEDAFKEEFPDVDISHLNFRRDFAGFNWSYLNAKVKTLIVADYYKRKSKKTKIVQLIDGRVMTMDDYKDLLESWSEFRAPPAIRGEPRVTMLDSICRYRCIDDQVLEYEEMDYRFLPLVFADGDSVKLKLPKDGSTRQFCKPYVYHAKGAQRLKNYSGNSLANEIENTVQHKFMVAKEALPKEEDFLAAYQNVQKANVLVFNSVYENDPNQPINMPVREIQRVPAPPEIMQGFTSVDSLVQMVLGSYDASLGINDNQLSGVAVVEAATQSNAAAMPYVIGFMQALQRVAEVIVDLIPKYYVTPRTIPMRDKSGMSSYIKINQSMAIGAGAPGGMGAAGAQPQQQSMSGMGQPMGQGTGPSMGMPQQGMQQNAMQMQGQGMAGMGMQGAPQGGPQGGQQGINMFYDSNVLNVKLEAGPSFQVQKSKALQQIIALMQASPSNPQGTGFADFVNSNVMVLVDNLDIRGIDQLKLSVENWLQQNAKAKAMMQQQQQAEMHSQLQPAQLQAQRMQIEQAKLQQNAQKMQMDSELEKEHIAVDHAKIQAQLIQTHVEAQNEKLKAATELAAKHDELGLKKAEHSVNIFDAVHKHGVAWHNATKPEPVRTST